MKKRLCLEERRLQLERDRADIGREVRKENKTERSKLVQLLGALIYNLK